MFKRIHRQEGAAAVEFALLAPLVFMLLFGAINFGIAFMHMQTMRGAVREGARYAATGGTGDAVRQKVVDSSINSIQNTNGVSVNPNTRSEPVCDPQNIGDDATVSYNVASQVNPDGSTGIQVQLIFFSVHLTPTITANFRCEV